MGKWLIYSCYAALGADPVAHELFAVAALQRFFALFLGEFGDFAALAAHQDATKLEARTFLCIMAVYARNEALAILAQHLAVGREVAAALKGVVGDEQLLAASCYYIAQRAHVELVRVGEDVL